MKIVSIKCILSFDELKAAELYFKKTDYKLIPAQFSDDASKWIINVPFIHYDEMAKEINDYFCESNNKNNERGC